MSHATTVHYDRSAQFYAAFLDPYMKYTSGLFTAGESSEDFERAAIRMLDKHISLIPDVPRARILDIGPGWGSFVRRLRERFEGEQRSFDYVAINPSSVQNNWLRDHVFPDIDIVSSSFEAAVSNRDQRDLGTFDAIYLIGSFCHLSKSPTLMAELKSLLNPGGRIVIEDTFYLSDALYEQFDAMPDTKFIQNEVFGTAPIVALPKFINDASDAGLNLSELLEHSSSYQMTLKAWIGRLSALVNTHPEAAEYIKYMKIAQRGWNYLIANYLVVLDHKRDRPRFVR